MTPFWATKRNLSQWKNKKICLSSDTCKFKTSMLLVCLWWEKDGRKSRAMGRLSSQLSSSAVGVFPVGATGDLRPVFAFLGIHRGGVCSWRHWGSCQRPCWSWLCDSRFQDLICSQRWGTFWSWQIFSCRHSMSSDSSPYFSDPKRSRIMTSRHTRLSNTVFAGIPGNSLGNSAQWRQT